MLLQLSGITKSFGKNDSFSLVLRQISLSILEGQIISIVGPSGSGKTSLLQIIGLLDSPDSGSFYLDGINCISLSENDRTLMRSRSIGFIYQFHCLLPDFTSSENLLLPQLIRGKTKKEAELESTKILTILGLFEKSNVLASNLSGGEQQRIAVARSIINNPKIILADEPTGNLDQHNSDIVFEILLKQVREKKTSAIIVTHNIDLAKKTDRIFMLNAGILKEV